MKLRIISLILTVSILLMCCGCAPFITKSDDLLIVTTIFPAYDFVNQIAGENADIHMLIKPGSEAHSYEPSPKDIQLISNCDLFVYVGGESDTWIDNVLTTIDNPSMKIVKMMDYANNIEEEFSEGMQLRGEAHSHESGDHKEEHSHHNEYDEHVWTSPINAISIVSGIADAIISIDPESEEVYTDNADKYIKSLKRLDNDFREIVRSGKRNTFVFGDRFPLLHFAKEYGLNYYAAYPGCAEESEPNIKTVVFLIEKVKQEKIPVIFHIELANESMTDTICEETGAEKMVFYSCHNVTAEEFENGATYLGLMQENLTALRKALN